MSYDLILDEMTWSFSRLSSFEQCPYGWYLRYIEEADRVYSNFFSEFGSYCHALLESYLKGNTPIYELPQEYAKGYNDAIPNADEYRWNDNYYADGEAYFEYGVSDLELYLADKEIIGVEKEIRTDIAGYPFVGYIDLVLRQRGDNGGYIIIDHKSAKYPYKKNSEPLKGSEKKCQDYKRQLYIYSKAIYEETGEYPTYLGWNFFRDGKMIGIPFNMDEYQEALKWAEDTIKRIYKESEFNPNPDTFFCNNICDYSCKECEYGTERLCTSSCTYNVQPERCDDKD